jgi:predicted dehydrogenase
VKEEGPRYILHGTHGSFLKWGIDPQEEALTAGKIPDLEDWGAEQPDTFGILNTEADGTEQRDRIPTIPGNYMAYYDNIYEHLRHGTELTVKAEESRNVIRIIEAAYASAEKGQTVRI